MPLAAFGRMAILGRRQTTDDDPSGSEAGHANFLRSDEQLVSARRAALRSTCQREGIRG
jgi:hypothetical protein